MIINFTYSLDKEKEKLLSVYDDYRWFIDNDFPVILPEFYDRIYGAGKKVFLEKLEIELKKVFWEEEYKNKCNSVRSIWKKVEATVERVFSDTGLPVQEYYDCYISLYGPEGQFHYPNVINVRAANQLDLKRVNETICHELLHLLIYKKVEKLELNYAQTEGVVDLFFKKTELTKLFPDYEMQSVGIHDEAVYEKIISKGGK